MDLGEITNAIAAWSAGQPLVAKVWLFGSRVRGEHRPDSDLDIAVELDLRAAGGVDESGGFATWAFETEGWQDQLQQITGLTIDLEQFVPGNTPTIQSALIRSSQLVYVKAER